MEGAVAHQGSPAKRGLNGNGRPQRFISIHTYHGSSMESTMVQVARWTYEFHCLPVGLNSAPQVFTKVLKPILALNRQRGLRIIAYLNDIMLMAQSPHDLDPWSISVIPVVDTPADTSVGGLQDKLAKVFPHATQEIQFLGLIVTCASMKLAPLPEKVKALTKKCWQVLQHQ